MTNKLQISKKFDDGTIILVGGETIDEFSHNYIEFIKELADLGLGIYGNPQMQDARHPLTDEELPQKDDKEGKWQMFAVENIKLATGGEHPRWVVQGGNFTKYGVTCWPEVLKDAGILDKLDPVKDNNPQGNWMAYFTEKPDGKPDKVFELVKS